MKKGRKGFTLIELLIVVVIVGILALAAIPLITSNTRDARRAEGEQILGSMKGQVRVAYAKLGGHTNISQLTGAIGTGGCGVLAAEMTGKYFNVTDSVSNKTNTGATLVATAQAGNASDGAAVLAFNWGGGDGSFTWSP
ncbi:MAG: prepilin-type N-terminal cleavage/methylation domain-containing protein [Planctomycetes bacterium]|jgi:prepilin-type N-terminal cleavage/methylation domain-containing protein|nr:prepilin-type N-terminal cleavage/methylation domain-containing protein [Planctomycetota bacterium]MCL4730287.1 prepilin-type N-terminal cleavage/methylation domain-containing protein [Planctomycetota bacterium]